MSITLVPAAQASAQLTRAEAGRVLGLGRRPVDRLVDGGWMSLDVADVAALAGRAQVVTDADLPVVRLGFPDRDHDDRRIGIAPGFTDEEVIDAARMWWRCDPGQVLVAGVLLVSVAGFAVAALAVEGLEASADHVTEAGGHMVRYCFEAQLVGRVDDLVGGTVRVLGEDPRTTPVLPALGNRLPNPPGAPLIVLSASRT